MVQNMSFQGHDLESQYNSISTLPSTHKYMWLHQDLMDTFSGMVEYCKSLIFRGYYIFPMNFISLEFNFADFAFGTLLQCTAKIFVWYSISQKQFIHKICKINPTQNLRLTVIIGREVARKRKED